MGLAWPRTRAALLGTGPLGETDSSIVTRVVDVEDDVNR